MIRRYTRKSLGLTVSMISFSPILYGIIAFFLDGKIPTPDSIDLQLTNTILLITSVTILIVSRPLEKYIAPDPMAGVPTHASKTILAAILVSALSETISIFAVIIVCLGADFRAAIPYLLISSISFLDFRLIRYQRLSDMMPPE